MFPFDDGVAHRVILFHAARENVKYGNARDTGGKNREKLVVVLVVVVITVPFTRIRIERSGGWMHRMQRSSEGARPMVRVSCAILLSRVFNLMNGTTGERN